MGDHPVTAKVGMVCSRVGAWGLAGPAAAVSSRGRAAPIAELVDSTHIGQCRGSNPVRWVVSPVSYPSATRAARVRGPNHLFVARYDPAPVPPRPAPPRPGVGSHMA